MENIHPQIMPFETTETFQAYLSKIIIIKTPQGVHRGTDPQ